MFKTLSLAIAGVMALSSATAALAQQHFDPTPEHIYYYGPAEQAAAKAAAPKAHAQAHQMTQTRHAHRHVAPAHQSPAPQG